MKTNFALFLLVIFTGAAVTGWEWPDIAKIMPVYVAAIPGLIMVSIQLLREMTGWETRKSAGICLMMIIKPMAASIPSITAIGIILANSPTLKTVRKTCTTPVKKIATSNKG